VNPPSWSTAPNSPYTRQPELRHHWRGDGDDLTAWHDRTIRGKLIIASAATSMRQRWKPNCAQPLKDCRCGRCPAAPRCLCRSHAGDLLHPKERREPVECADCGAGTDRRNPDVPALAVHGRNPGWRFCQPVDAEDTYRTGPGIRSWRRICLRLRSSRRISRSALTQSAPPLRPQNRPWLKIAGLAGRPFTQEELDRAKDDILNSFLFRYDTRDKVLPSVNGLEFYGFPELS